jgi:hypothetical protein
MASSQKDPRPILTYGQDAVLLETRRLLLEQGGFIADPRAHPRSFRHASLKQAMRCVYEENFLTGLKFEPVALGR